ncbi:MAG: YbhB/YbcL family Raf kinase inhibitor-like protein [Thermoguttaceae bacterium]|jgi:Raf kinase inhibitor-like YbhB/YbcL family protein|nr:YbhB/YbcL family Raf kinase inhibitor-like protein [Thermoguttaceae bacterium]
MKRAGLSAWNWLAAATLTAAALVGCQRADPRDQQYPTGQAKGEPDMATAKIRVSSTAFGEGEPIPRKHTGEGDDVSPPLAWSGLPDGTAELALIVDDPDAPTPEPWVHWVIYKIPATCTGLPEGVAKVLRPADPAGALQGKNSWTSGQTIGYRGPMPPPGHGVHRYRFQLYALRSKLTAEPGLTKQALLKAIEGQVIGQGQLTGTYQR